jgi:hypothetical protein
MNKFDLIGRIGAIVEEFRAKLEKEIPCKTYDEPYGMTLFNTYDKQGNLVKDEHAIYFIIKLNV